MYRTIGRVLLIATALLVLVVPVAAIGAGAFDDVSDDNVFKADIDWLASVGVTKGCNPPVNTKYCPDSYVTRGQMAAFMHRLSINRVVDAGTVGGFTASELTSGSGVSQVGKVVMSQGGGGWLANGFEAPSVFKRAGNAVIVGGGYATMGLAGPAALGDTDYGLASVTYCIFGASASEYVSVAIVANGTAEGSPTDDVWDWTTRDTDGCYTIPIGLSGGAFSISVRVEGSGLRIGEVESVWLPVADL